MVNNTKKSNISAYDQEGGFMQMMQKKNGIYKHFGAVATEIMRGEGVLKPYEREMIAVYVSELNDCSYCIASHTAVVNELDKSDNNSFPKDADAKWTTLLVFAKKVVNEASSISRPDIATLLESGWPEEVAEEVIHIVALFSYLKRITSAYGFYETPEMHKNVAKYLAKSYSMR